MVCQNCEWDSQRERRRVLSLKISLCATVKNEKHSIDRFIKSILNQSRLPDEIVIVDGGSTDGTTDVLRKYQTQHPDLLRIYVEPDANIARGRNISIAEARYDYIASADAGTEYPQNWLIELVHGFEENASADIIAGFFETRFHTVYEESISAVLYPKSDLINCDKFLPSARSVAFKKEVWKGIGGYAEWLPHGIGEDSHFFLRARNAGYKFVYAKNVTCYWHPRSDPIELFGQYFQYAKGASVGGFFSTFFFQAYGTNAFSFTARNLGRLLREGRFLCFITSVPILMIVLLGKVSGMIAGRLQKIRVRGTDRAGM